MEGCVTFIVCSWIIITTHTLLRMPFPRRILSLIQFARSCTDVRVDMGFTRPYIIICAMCDVPKPFYFTSQILRFLDS
ncbi:hypothetical protein EV424DRAFT_1361282 [Suillus variegatus]|nr:hypothetical protein EV424DRAFT_1361282 [Suillus variegatus]